MRVLLDECMPVSLMADLDAAGHDVERVSVTQPAQTDDEVLAMAASETRVLVTLDKDFGEFAVRGRVAHCGIVRAAVRAPRLRPP